jgi:hypothetical protein
MSLYILLTTHSCVAIHGWGSHAFGAFRAPNQNFMWLRDRLPLDVPNLRVWTYGYEFGLQTVESFAGIDEHAETFRHLLRSMRRGTQVTFRFPRKSYLCIVLSPSY